MVQLCSLTTCVVADRCRYRPQQQQLKCYQEERLAGEGAPPVLRHLQKQQLVDIRPRGVKSSRGDKPPRKSAESNVTHVLYHTDNITRCTEVVENSKLGRLVDMFVVLV